MPRKTKPKQRELIHAIRDDIVAGRLGPGAQLPPRRQLLRTFGGSPVTLQRAIRQLEDEGYVKAVPSLGTFVTPNPPCSHCYGIVFPGRPGEMNGWTRFHDAILAEAARVRESQDRQFRFYYGRDWELDPPQVEAFEADMQQMRIGGLFFVVPPSEFYSRLPGPTWQRYNIPAVVLSHDEKSRQHHCLVVDDTQLVSRGLDRLIEDGAKRIALIGHDRIADEALAAYRAFLDARGLSRQEYWAQALPRHDGDRTVQGLMALPEDLRPDGFLVLDEHALDPLLDGLNAVGCVPGEDVQVVSQAMLPRESPAGVTLLGQDLRQLLGTAVYTLEQVRNGVRVSRSQRMPVFFDSEVPSQRTVANLLTDVEAHPHN